MGEQSTINLLSNINGSLNKIVELMLPQNKDSAKTDADKVKNLSQGGLSSGGTKPKGAADQIEGLNISVSEIVSTLDGLPQQVLEIAKLADGTVDQFKTVLIGIAGTLSSKELRGISERDVDKLKSSIINIASVFASDEFLAISDDSANKSSELIIALSKLETLPNAIKSMSAVEAGDVQSLEVFIKSVAAVFKPETFAGYDSASSQKIESMLASIVQLNSLPTIIKNTSKVKKSDVQNLKSVVTEIVTIFAGDSFKDIDADSAKSAVDLITALSKLEKLPDVIKGASKVKERDVKTFAKAVGHIMEMITNSLRKTKVSKDDIQLAQNTADTIGKLASAMKSLAKMTLIAPLALVGVLAMIPVWLAFSAVAMLIGKMAGPINRGLRTLNRVDRFLHKMMKTALLGVVVAGSVVVLGMVVKNNIDTMLFGLAGLMMTFLAIGVIAILGGLVGLLVKSTNMFTKQIILFTLGLIAIAGLVIILGMLVKATWKEAMIGLAAMTVMLAYTLVLGIAAWVIGQLGLSMAQLKTMAGLMFLTMGLMAMTLLTVMLGEYVETHIEEALIGLAGTLTILGEVLLVAYVAKRVGNSSKSAVKDLLICEGVILGAQLIVYSTIKLGEILWDYIHTTEDIPAKLGILFVATTAIITGAWGVTKIANRASKDIKKGAIALLLAEGVILASALVVTVMIGVSKLLQNSGVEMQAIMLTLMVMGAIVAGAGAVAVVAGKFGSQIQKGALVMAVIELLILGMVGIVYAIVKTSEAANKLNNGWLDVLACVGFMVGLVAVMAAFAIGVGVMTANPYVAAALSLGLIMLTTLSLVIAAVEGVTFLTIALKNKIDKSGTTIKELGEMLHSITHELFTYENLSPGINPLKAGYLTLQYMTLIPVFLGMSMMIAVVSDMAKKFGGLSEKRDDGYYISPYYGMNGNEPVYGEPVNIPQIATQIVDAVTIFGDKLYNGFKGINVARLAEIGLTVGYLIDPVSKFAQMLTGLSNGKKEGTVRPVFVTQNGDIKYGAEVDVVQVAGIIAASISTFAKTLYGDGDELPNWMMFTRKRKGRKRIENAMNTLALIVEPVDTFTQLLTSFQSAGDGKIRKIVIDKDGNVDENAPYVDVIEVATSIATSIGRFADILFGDNPAWMKQFKSVDSNGENAATRAMKSLAMVITPVSSFVEALSALDPDGDKLYAVTVDNNGIMHKRPVDIVNTAVKIAEGISKFVQTLFGDATIDAWQNMIHATKGGVIEQATGESSEGAVGVLASVIDPISNFITAISTLGGEEGENGVLLLPIYDKDGRLVDRRPVDLVFTAETIAKSVEKFLRTLFSQENQNVWKSLIYGYNSKGELGSTASETLKDSVGIFTAVIDPVVKFMEVISKFGGTPDNFQIYDGKESRTINLIDVATSIATAVTTFVTHISTAFDSIKDFDADKKDMISNFASTLGSILENFTKIGDVKQEQLDLASNAIEIYFESLQTIKSKLEDGTPNKDDIVKLKETVIEARELFTIFTDIKFEELNYKQGLDEFKYIAQEAVVVSEILKSINGTEASNAVGFSVIDTYLEKVKSIHDFIVINTTIGNPDVLTTGMGLIEQMAESYTRLPSITDKEFKIGSILELYIEQIKNIYKYINKASRDSHDASIITTGVELVELMASSYLGLPVFGNDINKLAFITDYVNAVSLIRTALFTGKFNSDAIAMTNLVSSITNSVIGLTGIKEGDIKAVSNAYTGFLEKMITLSSRGNRKSLTDTHEAFDELTTSMTEFDKQLIKKGDDRKKKLEELIEQVEHLNDKLETTGTSMKKLVEYLEDIEDDKLDKVINAGQEMNNPRSGGGGGSGESGGSGEGAGTGGNVQTGGSNLSEADITNAILKAFKGMRLNSGSLDTAGDIMSAPAIQDVTELAGTIATAINSLRKLDFEFTTTGTFRE